jgi:hypothetical protein
MSMALSILFLLIPSVTNASVKLEYRQNASYRLCAASTGAVVVSRPGFRVLLRTDGQLRYGQSVSCKVLLPVKSSLPLLVSEYRYGTTRYALQAWNRLPGAPAELRLSRWTGTPTSLTMERAPRYSTVRVYGSATFHGKPVPDRPFRATRQGVPLDKWGRNIYIDSLISGSWKRINAILLNYPCGCYSLWVRPEQVGAQYRGRIIGPNFIWIQAPDAEAKG